MDERETLRQMLETSRQILMILEQQAAGFGALHMPAHLKIQLDEKRQEVAGLEARLAQMEGRRPDQLPNNLPRNPDIFVGRKADLARGLEALAPEERGWGVVIDGIGGIGKTALALEVAHAARQRAWFDAYLFASAKTTWLGTEGVRPETLALSSLDAFVREFARRLGADEIVHTPDATARRRGLLDALRGRRTLLIWDNLETLIAEERDMIAEFLRRLPGTNKAIITSRRRTGESAVTIRLDRLSEAEAVELMQAVGRRSPRVGTVLAQADNHLRRAFYEAAGGNPLALHWTLGLVAQKGYSLATAVERLGDAARSPDLYAFLFADALDSLEQSDKTVLSALAAFQTATGCGALADATDLPLPQIELALERLVTLSLVNDREDGHYSLHPLTRRYVQAALETGSASAPDMPAAGGLDPAARRKALRYWVDYAQQYGGGSENYQSFDQLETEWPNLEAAAGTLRDLAGLPGPIRDREAAQMLNDLADVMRQFLFFRGYWEERVRLSEWAYMAARSIGDWQSAGWRAYEVAWIHYNRTETECAATWAERMAEAMERGSSRRDRAYATRMRGLVTHQRGDLDEAERLFSEALETFREVEEQIEAIILNDLGEIARNRQDYDRAEEYYRQTLDLAEKLSNKEYQATRLGNLGELALDRHRPDEARR